MANILGNNPPQQQMQVDIKQSTSIKCECGYDVFISGAKFRKISKILTGSSQDMIIPIETFMCGSCGKINEDLLPPELKLLDK